MLRILRLTSVSMPCIDVILFLPSHSSVRFVSASRFSMLCGECERQPDR
jgi:hypothetical protein